VSIAHRRKGEGMKQCGGGREGEVGPSILPDLP
jgi:hypothetical protein